MDIYCLHCGTSISSNKKFCNSSCAAKHNNKGVRRHGNPPNNCLVCGNKTKSSKRFYCSQSCASSVRKKPEDEIKANNAARQSRYRAKQYRVIDPTADKEAIKEIYLNRPEGYEVDHIIPLSRGGKHHQDNLQYLTKQQNRSKNNRIW